MYDAIPSHLIESLTVDARPLTSFCFEPAADSLCGYSQALARLLTERTLSTEMEPILTGLLLELVGHCADDLCAPRWIHTDDGVEFIAELERVKENWMP